MKQLSKIDLESMEKELPVLEKSILESAKGGYSDETWNCLFNCMQYVGNQWGLEYDDQHYYDSFKKNMPYDPAGTYNTTIYDNDSHSYKTINTPNSVRSAADIEKFFIKSDFNYTIPQLNDMKDMNFNGSQIMFLKNSQGLNHAVIATGYDADTDTMSFFDPTSGASSKIQLNGANPKIYDICIPQPDSGIIGIPGIDVSGSLSGYYDDISGYNSPDGSYFA